MTLPHGFKRPEELRVTAPTAPTKTRSRVSQSLLAGTKKQRHTELADTSRLVHLRWDLSEYSGVNALGTSRPANICGRVALTQQRCPSAETPPELEPSPAHVRSLVHAKNFLANGCCALLSRSCCDGKAREKRLFITCSVSPVGGNTSWTLGMYRSL